MSQESAIEALKSVFKSSPRMTVEDSINVSRILTLDGNANSVKDLLRNLNYDMISHIDKSFYELAEHPELISTAKLFRLEKHYRDKNINDDYKLEDSESGIRITYSSIDPIPGF